MSSFLIGKTRVIPGYRKNMKRMKTYLTKDCQ